MSEKDRRCEKQIWDGFYSHRCTRKDWKDGYCKYHHPDSVKKRREDVDARVTAKLAEAAALQDKQRRQSEENAQLREEVERLREALTVAVKAEREACAKVCDDAAQRHKEQSDATYWALRDAAFQIRNRREKV